MNSIGKILDWFDKFFKRFKALGYIIAIIFLAIYFINKGFDQKEMLRMAEKITGLNMEKDLLLKQKDELRKERLELIDSIYYLKESRDSIQKLQKQAEKQAKIYRYERDQARDEIDKFTPTQNYVFLDQTAYPFIGEKKYPFNELQIKGMRETFVDNEYNKSIITSMQNALDNCNEQLEITSSIESVSEKAIATASDELEYADSISEVDNEIIKTLSKDSKKEKRREKIKEIWEGIDQWVGLVAGFVLGSQIK